MRRNITAGLLIFAAIALGAPIAQASPITVPSGLNPGDTYYLVFVTAGTRDATSPSIGDYDAFVTAQANLEADLLALDTTWKVIGSTADVSAAEHLGLITSPIYNLAGQLIATGSADLFNGTIEAPIAYDQHGNLMLTDVWTGTLPDGTRGPFSHFGSGDNVIHGFSNITGSSWIASVLAREEFQLSFYAVSGQLTVPPASVPEPATISLMMGPALLLLGRRLRRRRRLATQTTTSDPAAH